MHCKNTLVVGVRCPLKFYNNFILKRQINFESFKIYINWTPNISALKL